MVCQNENVSVAQPARDTHNREDDAWVLIPLFNEGKVIHGVVSDLTSRFSHILCVDDGSSDDSASIARTAGATVLRHPINLGQGAALQTGFDYLLTRTEATHVITFDADGQHRLADALVMLELARRKTLSVVFGSRFLDKRTKPGFKKRAVLKVAVLLTRAITGLRLTDAHNGLRVLSREALRHIRLQQNGMSHATEIVHQLAVAKLSWIEHPVEVLYTDYSRRKGQSLLNSINILIDLMVR